MAKDIATDNSDNASVGGTSSVFREPSQSGLDPVTELLATLTDSSTANAATTPFYQAPETQATHKDDTNNHRYSEQNENTQNQAEKDHSGSVKGEKQAEELQINEKLTPQTDAWQYRQQGQYQDTQAEQYAAEQGKNEHSGSLKDNQQAVQSQTESVGDKYPKFDKLLGLHEGGYDDFNTPKGSKYAAHRGEEIADGKKLSDLTVGEVMQMQKNGELFAAGHYQITPLAMKDAVRLAGVSPDEQFSPEIQDKLFEDGLLKKAGAGKLHNYITGKSDDIDKAMLATAQEWAAFPVPHDMHVSDKFGERDLKAGDSYYEGVKGNHSNMSLEDAKAAIEEMRANYLAAHSVDNQADNQSQETVTPAETAPHLESHSSGSLKDEKQAEVVDKDARKEPQNEQEKQEKSAKPHQATRQAEYLSQDNHHQNQGDNKENIAKSLQPPKYLQQPTAKSDNISGSLNKTTAHKFNGVRRISWREVDNTQINCNNPEELLKSIEDGPLCTEMRYIAQKMTNPVTAAVTHGKKPTYKNAAEYIFRWTNPTPGREDDFLSNSLNPHKYTNGDYHYSLGQCHANQELDSQYVLMGWAMSATAFKRAIHLADNTYTSWNLFIGARNVLTGKFTWNYGDRANVNGLNLGKQIGKEYGYDFGQAVKDLCGKEK